MSGEAWGMIGAGTAALIAGLFLVRARFTAASGVGRILLLGPVFEAVALAIFAAEHFLAARDLAVIVPRWMPGPLFWTYFVGAALLATAISFIAWRYVRRSASLLALLFLIIVATIDVPNLPKHVHERLFWTLTVRETAFAGGSNGAGGQPMVTRATGRRHAPHSGPPIDRLYIRLLCNRALSLPPLRPRCSVGKDDAGLGASAYAAGLCRRNNVTRCRHWANDSPHRRRHCGRSSSATHCLLLPSHPRDGDSLSARGGRGQLCGRHLTVRSDGFIGGLRLGLTENVKSRKNCETCITYAIH
jgi:uncharacterized membrane protein